MESSQKRIGELFEKAAVATGVCLRLYERKELNAIFLQDYLD